jgi:hypothetical protein
VPETVAIRSQSVDYFDALIDARYPGLGNTLLERLNAVPGWTSAICLIFPWWSCLPHDVHPHFRRTGVMVKSVPFWAYRTLSKGCVKSYRTRLRAICGVPVGGQPRLVM